MLGLGLQATLTNEGGGIAKKQPVKDGLVMYHQYQDFPTDSLRLSFPSEGSGEFNGTSDYIQLPSALPHTSFTASFWWNRGGSTGITTGIINGTGYNGNGWYTDTNASGALQFISGNHILTSSVTGIAYAKWDYITITYDGTTKRIYINGSLTASGAGTITTPTTYFQIGRYLNTSSYWSCNLTNLAIWNRALTPDEINTAMWASYDQLPTSIKVGLQAWYALDNITGTDVPDSTGNYNGTAY